MNVLQRLDDSDICSMEICRQRRRRIISEASILGLEEMCRTDAFEEGVMQSSGLGWVVLTNPMEEPSNWQWRALDLGYGRDAVSLPLCPNALVRVGLGR